MRTTVTLDNDVFEAARAQALPPTVAVGGGSVNRMRSKPDSAFTRTAWAWLAAVLLGLVTSAPADTLLYDTGFEASEGYDLNLDLIGQQGWQGIGSGGNGIVSGFFPGQGQQAYVGFTGPAVGDDSLFVFPILDFLPTACTATNIRFTVDLEIRDSANGDYDDFYWAVFNSLGTSLATLDFDNYSNRIQYAYNGQSTFLPTGVSFQPNQKYTLTLDLDFPGNRWSARLDNTLLVNQAPLTTTNAQRSLGDIDAAFVPYYPDSPGDNFMGFDNYRVLAQPGPPDPPRLRVLARTAGGTNLRVFGRPGCAFVADASTSFASWTALRTNTPAATGYFDYTDTAPNPANRRFYRARWVP